MDYKELCFGISFLETLGESANNARVNPCKLTNGEEIFLFLFAEKPAKSLCFNSSMLPFWPTGRHPPRLARSVKQSLEDHCLPQPLFCLCTE